MAAQRGGAYIRISAVMGRDEAGTFLSPDLQREAIKRFADARGITIVAEFEDIDVSGRTFERAGIRAALDAVDAGKIDCLVVLDLSRFGRNTGESLRNIAALRDKGVPVLSTVEQIDDTPEGQFQLGVFLGMAQLYSDQISRRWKQVVEHRVSKGLQHGGKIPLGYQRTPQGGVIIRDPEWAPRIVELFERYAAGETLRRIRIDYQMRFGRIANSSLRLILSNPVYIGRVNLNGRDYPGQHEPLVSDDLFERVQRRLKAHAGVPPRTLARSWSLSGLIYCGACGQRLQRRRTRARGDRPYEVRAFCANHSDGFGCPGVGTPLAEAIEAEVLREVRQKIDGWMVTLTERESRRQRVASATRDVARLRRAVKADEQALGQLGANLARGVLSEVAYRSSSAALEESLHGLYGQLAAAEALVEAPPADVTIEAARKLLDLWGDATPQERFRMLDPLLAGVIVTGPTKWRDPVEHRVLVVFRF